jgi:hypothetical protein
MPIFRHAEKHSNHHGTAWSLFTFRAGASWHTRTASPARARIALTGEPGTFKGVAGRPKDHHRFRLASGRQLWRLNVSGKLRLVDDALPIGSNEAKLLIAALVELGIDPGGEPSAVEGSRPRTSSSSTSAPPPARTV